MSTARILENLSIVNCFHDKQKNILDTFLPIVEYAIYQVSNGRETKTSFFTLTDVQLKIEEKFSKIPLPTLKYLFKQLEKANKVRLLGKENIQIIDDFAEENTKYQQEVNNKNRDINKFIREFKNFSKSKQSDDEIKAYIYEFITAHKRDMNFREDDSKTVREFTQQFKIFGDFLHKISQEDSELLGIFKDIFYGYILCGLLNGEQAKLSDLYIVLDSNFLLRILDLQEPFYNKIAKEILINLKNIGVRICIYQETLNIVRDTIEFYQRDYFSRKQELKDTYYINADYVAGVIGAFIREDMSRSDIDNLLAGLDFKRLNKRIDCSITPLHLTRNTKSYDEEVAAYLKLKSEKKNFDATVDNRETDYYRRQAQHYIEVIHVIRDKRKYTKTDLGNCEHVFLTCDNTLYMFNKGNRKDFPEVINEEKLVNSLVFINFDLFKDIQIQQLIALFSASKYISLSDLDSFADQIGKIAHAEYGVSDYVGKVFRNQNLIPSINEISDNGVFEKDDLLKLIEKEKEEDKKRAQVEAENLRLIEEQKGQLTEQDDSIKNLSQSIESKKKDLEQKDQIIEQQNKIIEKLKIEFNRQKLRKYNWFYVLYVVILLGALGIIGATIAYGIIELQPWWYIISVAVMVAIAIFSEAKGYLFPWQIHKKIIALKKKREEELMN